MNGDHIFSPEIEKELRKLTDADAVTVLEEGHSDIYVEGLLEDSSPVVPETSYLLANPITKEGVQLLCLHEWMTADSLFLIQSARCLGRRINSLRSRIGEVMEAIQTAEDRERKGLEKEREQLEKALVDCEDLDSSITRIIQQTDETGKTVGWKPELDDGVILNMAPLRELFPSWKAEPVKFWKELEAGKYDWSYSAMRYWPERVRAACKRKKSYAIAHGLEEEYEG
ncbi:hypothetical protein [Methanospirillum sp.]|uniref:hypothetical protein n=1 Tax=Methanospirillum sp. TaxID=45200 RepID=UPI002BCB9365|nr:hypothetical protein [Methanospirillum sp.]HPP78735.1 hypothetical protein [Methanospirillum sp.]